jgi:hypothetical protein
MQGEGWIKESSIGGGMAGPICKRLGNVLRFAYIFRLLEKLGIYLGRTMTASQGEVAPQETDAEMAERLRPLVNEILETFNQREISPSEAGMVILSLIYRLLEVLKEAPEARRHFILTMINLINNFLAAELEIGPAPPGDFLVKED